MWFLTRKKKIWYTIIDKEQTKLSLLSAENYYTPQNPENEV